MFSLSTIMHHILLNSYEDLCPITGFIFYRLYRLHIVLLLVFVFFYYNGFCSSCNSCTSSSACVLRLLSALSPSLDGTSLSRFLLLCFYDSFKSPEGEPSGLCLHALWLCPCLCSLVSCPLLLLTAELSFFVLDVLFCFFFFYW